jgi:hypothetical protein
MSTAVVSKLAALAGELPIIGVGGIMSGADARREDGGRCEPGPVLHRLHLPRPGASPKRRRRSPATRRAAACRDRT